jgi:L-threonylcarbamoyladenylate synthase
MRELNCSSSASSLLASNPKQALQALDPVTAGSINEAAFALSRGHLVAFPTETVYGLGADGYNPSAVLRIFEVKGRPKGHPLILHAANLVNAMKVSNHWTDLALGLAEAFWPGPLTLVLKKANSVPLEVTGGQDSVGIRVPNQVLAQLMLQAFAGRGSGLVAAPSANRFGAVSPTRARDVVQGLGPFLSGNDCLLTAADCDVGLESTIVDCREAVPRLLRPGGLSRDSLNAWLQANEFPLLEDTLNDDLRVSGNLASHYAPRCPLVIAPRRSIEQALESPEKFDPFVRLQLQSSSFYLPAGGVRLGLLLLELASPAAYPSVTSMSSHSAKPSDPAKPYASHVDLQWMARDAQAYARLLYQRLNDWDQAGVELILVESPPESSGWEAVWDRLRRAATKR